MKNMCYGKCSPMLDLFLSCDLPWRDTLMSQIAGSKMHYDDCFSSLFIHFEEDEMAIRVPVSVEVPFEVLIGNATIPPSCILGRIGRFLAVASPSIVVEDVDAFSVRPHFRNGYMFELEAYSLNANKIDICNALYKSRTYLIYSRKDVMQFIFQI